MGAGSCPLRPGTSPCTAGGQSEWVCDKSCETASVCRIAKLGLWTCINWPSFEARADDMHYCAAVKALAFSGMPTADIHSVRFRCAAREFAA